MDGELKSEVAEALDAIERKTINRLSRGSVRVQSGRYMSSKDWSELRSIHQDKFKKICKAFYPEKYAEKN